MIVKPSAEILLNVAMKQVSHEAPARTHTHTHTHTHTQSIGRPKKTLGPFVKENKTFPQIKLEDSSISSKTPKNLVLNPGKWFSGSVIPVDFRALQSLERENSVASPDEAHPEGNSVTPRSEELIPEIPVLEEHTAEAENQFVLFDASKNRDPL
jgi:hypothetical protein